ncbi:alpha/beta hydrolase [Streptococcus loxodontisalivarius]|uniref:Pimeloyl-ACP methyl ester carboxylesterase n=1 Tax=Streptococcus loxodontisalivarius TaxID=1349415 RepID=A0ABS2PRL1_9STRE|nr:alpha/beta fold hydrolase [Streptococcus loxodontisalivarius]MBM7642677.1 pimeloyl-ACP methyl ester carboxylesterase [Streptococcus loxodontisalivarius]
MKKLLISSLVLAGLALGLTACSQQSSSTSSTASSAISTSSTSSSQAKGNYTVTEQELTFESNGNRIYGRALLPDTDEAVPTVILSHGFGGNHEQEETLQEDLAASGIAVYSFDFSGGTGYEPGQSEGDMTDMSVLTEEQNLKDALSMIQTQDFADKNQIYLMGASQGGVVTTLVAEEEQDQIAGVFLLYPAFSLFDDARDRFASESDIPDTYNLMGLTVGSRYFTDIYNMDIYDHMTYSGPVHIFHGDADNLVNISYSERAAQTFPNATLTTVSGGTHGFATSDQELIAPTIASEILGD